MRYTAATVAFAAVAVASPVAQGVTEQIKPDSSAPSGCSPNYDGEFQIQVTNVTSSNTARSINKRQQANAMKLEITLKDGVLLDSQDRTGYIAANHQFQFDGPPQTGAIYTAGWSACANGSLALGGEATFHQCLSGDFYNLYDESTGEQCNEVTTQIPDGQIQAAPTQSPVSQIPDGQIQAPYSNGTAAAAPAPSGTGAVDQPAPFEGSANKAYTIGAAAVVAFFGFVVAL